MRNKITSRLLIAGALGLLLATALPSSTTARQEADVAKSPIEKLLGSGTLAGAHVGILAVSMETGQPVYELRSDEGFVPASINKLLVCCACLSALGPDHRFATRVYTTGRISGAKLFGDIVLRGGGDPTLDLSGLDRLALRIRQMGLLDVTGNVVVDASIFQENEDSPSDRPMPNGLSVEGNLISLIVGPTKDLNAPAQIQAEGCGKYLRIVNRTVVSEPDSKTTLRARSIPSGVEVSGRVPAGSSPRTLKVPVNSPETLAASVLLEKLKAAGVRINGDVRPGLTPQGARPVTAIQSPPLSEILKHMLSESDNLYAEQLLLALGAARFGSGITRSQALNAVSNELETMGLDMTGITVADGSGLSRSNRVTPRFVVNLLRAAWSVEKSKQALLNALPQAGSQGNLTDRFAVMHLPGVVLAKSGSLWRISNLAGYYWNDLGDPYAFVVMVNDSPEDQDRRNLDRIVDGIVVLLMSAGSQVGGAAKPDGE